MYEERCGTGATVTVRNISDTLGEDTFSINAVMCWFKRDMVIGGEPRSRRPPPPHSCPWPVHLGIRLSVSLYSPTPKGVSGRYDYWWWELSPPRFYHASCRVAPRGRSADANQVEPSPQEVSPLLLLGFVRSVVIRTAPARTHSRHWQHLRPSASETGGHCTIKMDEMNVPYSTVTPDQANCGD